MSRDSVGGGHLAPVSVVIPLYNEAATVSRLFHALGSQSHLPAEVVCVDAGSTDGTAEHITVCRVSFPVRLLREGRMNPGEARNAGVKATSHAWIAFADGGTEPDRCWLQRLMDAAREDTDVVFGSYDPLCDTFFRCWAALAYVPSRGPEGIRGPSIVSTALTRRAFDMIGGFPVQRASEDLVFIERVYTSALRVSYAPGAVVVWQTAPGVRSTFRRFALYSKVNLEVGRGRHWHQGLARQTAVVIAVASVAALAGMGLWSLVVVPAWYLARATKAARTKRRDLPFPVWRPDLLLGAAAVLVVIDLATWSGAVRWFVESCLGRK